MTTASTLTLHVPVSLSRVDYDPEPSDVLYLSAPSDEGGKVTVSREGHAVRLDEAGRVVHVTFVSARRLLERDGTLVATLPDGRQLELDAAQAASLVGLAE